MKTEQDMMQLYATRYETALADLKSLARATAQRTIIEPVWFVQRGCSLVLITPSEMGVGNVLVSTTENKGHDPDFWADSAADRIVSVGGNCHPAIAEQANEFKRAVRATVLFYIKEAIRSDRVTLAAEFENQGHADMANIIRSL